MRTLHAVVGAVVVVAGPLVLTGAGSSLPAPAPDGPTRCYGGAVYEPVSGYPDARQLFQAHLRAARSTLADLRERAPQLTDDPYFPGFLGRAQGDVEAFTALAEVARRDPRPPLDRPVSAVDEDGELVARVEFSTTIAAEQGTYAISTATLPAPDRDPAAGCGPRASS